MTQSFRSSLDYYHQVQQPVEECLAEVTRVGMHVCVETCIRAAESLQAEIDELAKELPEINWGSWQQKEKLLYDDWQLPIPPIEGSLDHECHPKTVKLTPKGKRPTSGVALHWLWQNTDDAQLRHILHTAMLVSKKVKDRQFAAGLPQHRHPDGRVHPQITCSTETGRTATKKPNLANQPESIRAAFPAPPGKKLIVRDFAALEWRVLAHILVHRYGDRSLLDDILADVNPHGATAVLMGLVKGIHPNQVKTENRNAYDFGKTFNYSVCYGATKYSLGGKLTDSEGAPIGVKAAQQELVKFFNARAGITRFHKDIIEYARRHGLVRSLLGRPRYLTDINSKQRWKREAAERLAKNVVQPCAADIMTTCLLRTSETRNDKLRDLGCRLVNSVYDELVFEVPEENAEEADKEIEYQMVNCLDGYKEFLCPLETSGGVVGAWSDGH